MNHKRGERKHPLTPKTVSAVPSTATSPVFGVSPSSCARLRYTSETIAGATFAFALRRTGALTAFARSTALTKAVLFSKKRAFPHLRKCIRQTNGFSDKGTEFAEAHDVRVNAVSPSLLSCLRYTSETIAGADTKAKVFSRLRKCVRQINGVSDKRKTFAVTCADANKQCRQNIPVGFEPHRDILCYERATRAEILGGAGASRECGRPMVAPAGAEFLRGGTGGVEDNVAGDGWSP